jgi:hypothetical protein
LAEKTGGRYTFTIWSKTKTTEEALDDFSNSQELSSQGSEKSDPCARIPMGRLETILESIRKFIEANGA